MYSTRSRSGVIGGCQPARTADNVIRVCSAARAQSWRFGSFESPLMAVRRMASLPGSKCQA